MAPFPSAAFWCWGLFQMKRTCWKAFRAGRFAGTDLGAWAQRDRATGRTSRNLDGMDALRGSIFKVYSVPFCSRLRLAKQALQ